MRKVAREGFWRGDSTKLKSLGMLKMRGVGTCSLGRLGFPEYVLRAEGLRRSLEAGKRGAKKGRGSRSAAKKGWMQVGGEGRRSSDFATRFVGHVPILQLLPVGTNSCAWDASLATLKLRSL